jgi:hypothetical protein
MAVWYSLWSFDIFFPFWYVYTKKNLATLLAITMICILTFTAKCSGPFLTSPLGANFEPRGEVVPQ